MKLTNTNAFTIAVFKAGGAEKFIDVEEAYVACWEISPQRFSWRTRRDLPDREKCYKALAHTKNNESYPFVRQGAYRIRLSAEGVKWLEKHKEFVESLMGETGSKVEFKPNDSSRQLDALKRTGAYKSWVEHREVSGLEWELAAALRCSTSSPAEVWIQRLNTVRVEATLSGQQEIIDFVDELMSVEQLGKFGGEGNG